VLCRGIACAAACVAAGGWRSGARAGPVESAQIERLRVAFTLNFARFTAWPDGATTDPFRLCVMGGDSLFAAFAQTEGALVRGRPVQLRRVQRIADAVRCELLYTGGFDAAQASFEALAALPVLTVGEDPAFLARGGTIRLFTGDQRMEFDVNLPQAERARLVLSPQLLRLARTVIADKG